MVQLPATEAAQTPWLTRKVLCVLNVYVHLVCGWRCGRDAHICTSIVLKVKWKDQARSCSPSGKGTFCLWQKQDCFLFTLSRHPNKIMSWQSPLQPLLWPASMKWVHSLLMWYWFARVCWKGPGKSVFWLRWSWGCSAFVIITCN